MSQIPFDAIRTWMFQAALPLWGARGVDARHGGFLEELTLSGEETACNFKRVRVQCRQIYAFSHAAVLGWKEGAALSALGCDYLVRHARLPDGGWAKTLTRDGAVLDATPDLYDLAFVIFAMAWRYRASGDAQALRDAHATLDFIQTHMRAPEGGFWPRLPAGGALLQNPHMHLTEACLAAFEASGDQRFLDQANDLVALLRAKLFDGRSLGERFSTDWARIGGEEGRVLEPGHHFEWAWILAQHQKLSGISAGAEAQALCAFAERHGVDAKSHAAFDAVRDDGAALRKSSRAWTNTERIKGWLGVYEITGRDPNAEVSQSMRLLFDRYFADYTPGLWVDQFDENGEPMTDVVPASIVYHLFLAFAECLRLEPKLSKTQTL